MPTAVLVVADGVFLTTQTAVAMGPQEASPTRRSRMMIIWVKVSCSGNAAHKKSLLVYEMLCLCSLTVFFPPHH